MNNDVDIKIPAAAFMTMVGGAGKIIVLKVDSEKPDHLDDVKLKLFLFLKLLLIKWRLEARQTSLQCCR